MYPSIFLTVDRYPPVMDLAILTQKIRNQFSILRILSVYKVHIAARANAALHVKALWVSKVMHVLSYICYLV